eukprot:3395694-Pyramimonas_sp.AAC.1
MDNTKHANSINSNHVDNIKADENSINIKHLKNINDNIVQFRQQLGSSRTRRISLDLLPYLHAMRRALAALVLFHAAEGVAAEGAAVGRHHEPGQDDGAE